MTNAGLLSWVKSRVRGSADFRSERGSSIQTRASGFSSSSAASPTSSTRHHRQQHRPQPPIPRQHRRESDCSYNTPSSTFPSPPSTGDGVPDTSLYSPPHIYEEISCCIRGCHDARHTARDDALAQTPATAAYNSSPGDSVTMDNLMFEEAKQFGRFLIVPMKRRADRIAEEGPCVGEEPQFQVEGHFSPSNTTGQPLLPEPDVPRLELRNGAVYRQRGSFSTSGARHAYPNHAPSTASSSSMRTPLQLTAATPRQCTSPLTHATVSTLSPAYRSCTSAPATPLTFSGDCSPGTEDSGFSSADQWSPRPVVKRTVAGLDRQASAESVPSDSYVRVLNSSLYGSQRTPRPLGSDRLETRPPLHTNSNAGKHCNSTSTYSDNEKRCVFVERPPSTVSATSLRVPTPTTTSILYGQTTAPDVKGHRVSDTPIRELTTPTPTSSTPYPDATDSNTPTRDLATPTRHLATPTRHLATPPCKLALTPSRQSAFCPPKPTRKSLESSYSVYPPSSSSSPDASPTSMSSHTPCSSLSSICSLTGDAGELKEAATSPAITGVAEKGAGHSVDSTGFLTDTQAKSLSFVERLSCSSHAWPRQTRDRPNTPTNPAGNNSNVMMQSSRIELVL